MGYDFDLFVIGGGSGGVRAARVTAALRDKRVGLAEMDRYGGTCVIRGCVPKKLMVFASDFPSAFKEAIGYGWELPNANRICLLYTSPSPRDGLLSRMPSSA